MNKNTQSEVRSKQQKFQADYYNGFAEDFDTSCNRENSNHLYKIEQICQTFFQNLPPGLPGYDFMELGSGTGIHAYHFMKMYHQKVNSLLLTDISANMLQQAERRLEAFKGKVRYAVMPAEKITVDRQFDGIFVSGSMHHFASPVAALAEMKKHLKPSGLIIVCEPIVWNPINFLKCLREIKAEYGQFRTQRCEVRKLLKQLGYQIVADRVLHYRSGNELLRQIVPSQKLEKYSCFNFMAVMFLFGAKGADAVVNVQ